MEGMEVVRGGRSNWGPALWVGRRTRAVVGDAWSHGTIVHACRCVCASVHVNKPCEVLYRASILERRYSRAELRKVFKLRIDDREMPTPRCYAARLPQPTMVPTYPVTPCWNPSAPTRQNVCFSYPSSRMPQTQISCHEHGAANCCPP